jgi:hypothetical protein
LAAPCVLLARSFFTPTSAFNPTIHDLKVKKSGESGTEQLTRWHS